jgi:hypothetical protein
MHLRPRTLVVDRRDPSKVARRVLRRLSWTSADEVTQYEKIESAYTVAEWSEEHFNNRALFSDHYLLTRLQEAPEWKEDVSPVFRRFRDLFRDAGLRLTNKPEGILRQELLEPVLNAFGFTSEVTEKTTPSEVKIPDYRLFSDPEKKNLIALLLAYPWDRSLDGKDDHHDKETPDENPGAMVVSLLARGEAPWVIVTNGKVWRLYGRDAHSRATNYYEQDAEEILSPAGAGPEDIGDSFRYFWLLFRATAMNTRKTEGEKDRGSFLDRVLRESQEYARDLGDRLKGRIFDEVFLTLAQGFLSSGRRGTAEPAQEDMDSAHQATLTFLYRLLFLFYAEARDLLPVREGRGYPELSLKRIKEEIVEAAGRAEYERKDQLKKKYTDDSFDLYKRLAALFRAIDQGDPDRDVPRYNGGLFLTEPDPAEAGPEAVTARYLLRHKVPDLPLALALDLLAREEDKTGLGFVDYKSLGVRQLGSIYEGLLEFKLRVADRKLAVVMEKGHEVWVPFAGLNEAQRARAGRDADNRIVRKGSVYLENDRHERKATGSYYTPDHIVAYIVNQAVGPVLKEKHEAIRPKIREAVQARIAFKQKQDEMKRLGLKPEPDAKADLIGENVVRELFDVKVLDPAMGSGHFLVEAVDYITDKTIEFLNAFPWNPVTAYLDRMKATILREMDEQQISINPGRLTHVNLLKRHVLKRCIYGVDLNPMAVELAKVSLWLDCFTLGAPLSFLDHHLRCGNSLIGSQVEEARNEIEGKGQTGDLFGSRFAGLMLATDCMRQVGELSDVTSAQVNQSRQEYRKASSQLAPFKRLLDIYTARWFGAGEEALALLQTSEIEKAIKAPTDEAWRKALGSLSKNYRTTATSAGDAAIAKKFFHWELEFPEVFYGPRPGTRQTIERLPGAGFDAVIGNPPYDVLASKELGADVSEDLAYFKSDVMFMSAQGGKLNLYKLFICRGVGVARIRGHISYITPMTLLGDEQAQGVRKMLLRDTGLIAIEAFPQKDDPVKRVFKEAKLSTSILVTTKDLSSETFAVRTHVANIIKADSSRVVVSPKDIAKYDPVNCTIPCCSARDWAIVSKILSCPGTRKFSDYIKAFQGEVNETGDGSRGFLGKGPSDGPEVLRGAAVCLYAIREASQGEPIYLRKERFLKGKPGSEKAHHHEAWRIGWQRNSPQNNFRRIIAAKIPPGEFCNDVVNYIPQSDSQLSLDFVLAVLNSCLADWFFRIGSTNAHVNTYQVYGLPVPTIPTSSVLGVPCKNGTMLDSVVKRVEELSGSIQRIESDRKMLRRSDRSHLDPQSQPLQDEIDGIFYACFGLSDDEASYIRMRQQEML